MQTPRGGIVFSKINLGVALDEQRVLDSTQLQPEVPHVGGIGTPAASHSSM